MQASSSPAPNRVPPAFGAVRFSTADYAPRDRLAAWHDIYGRTLLKLDIEPLEPDAFDADVVLRRLPGLGIVTGARAAAIYRRRRERIDHDDVVISFALSGGLEAMQRGRSVIIAQGEAVAVTAGEAGHVRFDTGGKSMTLCVPARALAAATGGQTTICRRIGDSPALRLLARYVGILEDAGTAAPELQRRAVTHIHDLVGLALGASGDAAAIARLRGARAARLDAIKRDIVEHPGGDLSVAAVARRHRLPVRYVQRLFEADGVTLTEFVLAQRLDRAYQLLASPRSTSLAIGAIAFEVGFADLSYFNRTFRRRFGASPSDVRAQARGGAGHVQGRETGQWMA